ncbi:hypothetical protein [Rubrivirga sp.]|uniref:hypothetical protein n=1 Tax=Rubrivirga sp. TaxID=1885344 RepID=UPI003B526E43
MRLSLLALVLAASAASAQPEWRTHPARPSVSLDALYAVGDDDLVATDDQGNLVGTVDAVSSVLLLSGRVPVGARWGVRAEVPLAYTRFSGPNGLGGVLDESDTAIGNPYVGVEASVGRSVVLGAGVRVPLFNDVAESEGFGWQGGLGADFERFEAYVPDLLTVSASAVYARALGPAVRLRGRLTPAVVADVSGAENANGPGTTDVVVGYGLQAEADVRAVALRGGVVGRQFLTGRRFEAFETTATVVAGATVEVVGIRPGLLVRVPLDRDRFYLDPDATVGLTLDVPLR